MINNLTLQFGRRDRVRQDVVARLRLALHGAAADVALARDVAALN